MAVTYFQILADVMNQMNNILSRDVSELDTNYSNIAGGAIAPGVKTSTDWPVEMMKMAILDAEYELMKEICFNGRHLERGDFIKVSGNLSNQALLPKLSSDVTPYIGIFDHVRQTTTGYLLTPRSQTIVEWAVRNANSAFSSPDRALVYCISGGMILHNAASPSTVVLYGPAVARGTFSDNLLRVRDYHRAPVVAGALTKMLAKEGAYQEAFQDNAAIWAAHIEQVRSVGQQVAEALPSQF